MKIPTSAMRETISHTPRTGYGGKGAVYGAETENIPCYAEPSHRRIINKDNTETVATIFFCLGPSRTYQTGDKITYDGREYQVIEAQPVKVTGRVHHWEVYAR